jgi:hypothetical protein
MTSRPSERRIRDNAPSRRSDEWAVCVDGLRVETGPHGWMIVSGPVPPERLRQARAGLTSPAEAGGNPAATADTARQGQQPAPAPRPGYAEAAASGRRSGAGSSGMPSAAEVPSTTTASPGTVRAIPGSRAAALARPPEKAAVSLTGAGTIVSAIPSAARGPALTRRVPASSAANDVSPAPPRCRKTLMQAERWDQAVACLDTALSCALACPPGESSGCPRSASLARRGSQNPIANALASSTTVASVVH